MNEEDVPVVCFVCLTRHRRTVADATYCALAVEPSMVFACPDCAERIALQLMTRNATEAA